MESVSTVQALDAALRGFSPKEVEQAFEQVLASGDQAVRKAAAELLLAHGLYGHAAELHRRNGDTDRAISLFVKAGLFSHAGWIAEGTGDLVRAESLYRQGCALDVAEAVFGQDARSSEHRLGLLLLRQGRFLESVGPLQTALRQGLSKTPPPTGRLAELQGALLRAFWELRFPELAVAFLQRLRAQDPLVPPTVQEFLLQAAHKAQPVGQNGFADTLLLGRYQLLRLLGAGGLGRVFLARDVSTQIDVAVKLLPQLAHDAAQTESLRRFGKEARVLRSLRHKNLVSVLDVSEQAGVLVMEFLPGGSWADQAKPVSLAKTRRMLLDVSAALVCAHANGVLHGDVKPANLFLDAAHGTKLGDFGAAHVAMLGETQTENVLGTLAYAAPEQLAGEPLDFSTDLYALGVTCFELLTAHLPASSFPQNPSDPRQFRPSLPQDWVALCQRLLAPHRADRFPSMDAFVESVQTLSVQEDRGVSSASEAQSGPSGPADAGRVTTQTVASGADAEGQEGPNAGRRLLYETPHSQVWDEVDVRLSRGVFVETFSPRALLGNAGERHLAWLRCLAKHGGPGLQRVLRMVTQASTLEVHAEDIEGIPFSSQEPLRPADLRILARVLSDIHADGQVYGNLERGLLFEKHGDKHGAVLLVTGQGPLSWTKPPPTPQEEQAQLAAWFPPRDTR
jgi:serine/threonine-protein kinase